MPSLRAKSHYEILGVHAFSTLDELRAAYRTRARECHPDLANDEPDGSRSAEDMARLNEAWRVLSDDKSRELYDLSIRMPQPEPQPAPQTGKQRRRAWVAGVEAQMTHLARLAGRSSTQTMLTREPKGPRSDYDNVVDHLVESLTCDIEARVRAARAAGVAPLDLGVAAILVGIRSEADKLRRLSSLGIDTEMLMAAELLDRMWDVLAHELPHAVSVALGGNPQLSWFLARSSNR